MIELGSPQYHATSRCLALGSFLVFCNLYLFQPLLPQFAVEFQMTSTQVNWIFAVSTLALSLFLLPWAMTSERFGRRSMMCLGLFLLPVIGIGFTLVEQWWALVFLRGCLGVAIAAFAAVAVAYMVEEFSPQAFTKAMGLYIAANSLGGLSGRIIGGLITNFYDWHMAVAVMAAISFMGACWVTWTLPAQQHFQPTRTPLMQRIQVMGVFLRTPILSFAMLIGGINFALFVNLYSVMGFRLTDAPYNLPVGLAALIFVCYLGGTVSAYLSSRWRRHHSSHSGMVLGACISCSGMLLALFNTMPALLAGLVLISFGAFFTHTLAYSWVGQHAQSHKATATAMYPVCYYIGGSLGGFFLLYCWQQGGWSQVCFGGGCLYAVMFVIMGCLKWLDSNEHLIQQFEH